MSELNLMTREELYQEVLRLRSRLDVTDDMVERAAPVVAFRTPEAWARENDQFKSYYRKQARDFLTAALSELPSSKLGDATQKTGQSAENAEGAGSSPAGVDALTYELAEARLPTEGEARAAAAVLLRCNGHDLDVWTDGEWIGDDSGLRRLAMCRATPKDIAKAVGRA